MSKELANKLKKAREKLELSQVQAAQTWGIPIHTLTKWEQDQSTPRGFALDQLNRMLDEILSR